MFRSQFKVEIYLLMVVISLAYQTKVQAVQPTLQLISPIDGSTVNCSGKFIANATFESSAISGEISVYSGDCRNYIDCTEWAYIFCFGTTCSLNEPIQRDHGGPYAVTVRASTSYSSTEENTTFYVDCTPLLVSITSPAGWVSEYFDIAGNVNFQPVGTSYYQGKISIYLDDKLIDSMDCSTENCNYSYKRQHGKLYTLPPGGPYTLVLKADGNHGGTASDKRVFYVNSAIPNQNQGPPDCP